MLKSKSNTVSPEHPNRSVEGSREVEAKANAVSPVNPPRSVEGSRESGVGRVPVEKAGPSPSEQRKLPFLRVERPECGGFCIYPLRAFDAADEFDGAEAGEQIILEYVEMTQLEFDALPEFTGW